MILLKRWWTINHFSYWPMVFKIFYWHNISVEFFKKLFSMLQNLNNTLRLIILSLIYKHILLNAVNIVIWIFIRSFTWTKLFLLLLIPKAPVLKIKKTNYCKKIQIALKTPEPIKMVIKKAQQFIFSNFI